MNTKQGFIYNEKDVDQTRNLLKILAGTGLLSAGVGASYYGLKQLIDANYRKKLKKELSPASLVHEVHESRQTPVENDLLAFNKEGGVVDGTMSVLAAPFKALGSGLYSLGGYVGSGVVDEAANATKRQAETAAQGAKSLAESIKNNIILGVTDSKNIKKEDLANLRDSNKSGIKGVDKLVAALSAYPNLKPLWAVPAGVGLAYGGYYAGKSLMKGLKKLFIKDKEKDPTYLAKARKIYNDSAEYFRDTVNGKKASVKSAAVASDGSSNGFGFTNPSLYLGILGAGLVAKQIKDFKKGYDAAGKEIADSTHMLRAWQAAAEERNPDYAANLEIALEKEPDADDEQLKSILRKERRLESSLKKASLHKIKIKQLL